MPQNRYPYAAAARWAAVPFTVTGAITGSIAGSSLTGGPGALPNAFLWAALAGGVSFLAYASRAPRRPISGRQAASADGVIAGTTVGLGGGLIDLLVASGGGSIGGNGPSRLDALGFVLITAGGGAILGGLLGIVVFQIAGSVRMQRVEPARVGKRGSRGSRPVRSKRK